MKICWRGIHTASAKNSSNWWCAGVSCWYWKVPNGKTEALATCIWNRAVKRRNCWFALTTTWVCWWSFLVSSKWIKNLLNVSYVLRRSESLTTAAFVVVLQPLCVIARHCTAEHHAGNHPTREEDGGQGQWCHPDVYSQPSCGQGVGRQARQPRHSCEDEWGKGCAVRQDRGIQALVAPDVFQ